MIVKLALKIENSISKLYPIINEIQRLAEANLHILTIVHNQKNRFFAPVMEINEEIKKLKLSSSFQEYQQAFIHFQNGLQQNKKEEQNSQFVRYMIGLIKDSCVLQLQLEALLDTPIKIANLLKQQASQIFNDDVPRQQQSFIIKYVNMITKPGFVQTQLKKTNLSELISFIKLMEKQKGLIHEIRQFSQDSENLIILNEEQFKDIYQRWELCCQAIDQLKKNEDYKLEFKFYKSEMQGSLSELKNFSDKLWDYQKSLIEYHKLQSLITRVQIQIQKYLYKEHQIRVELISNDLNLGNNFKERSLEQFTIFQNEMTINQL